MVESFLPRQYLGEDILSKLPWPLGQQYEQICYWMKVSNEPGYVAWKLKDAAETLIKLLTTLVMAEDIQKLRTGEKLPTDCPIFELVKNAKLSTGTWVAILKLYRKYNHEGIIQNLMDVTKDYHDLEKHLDRFVEWRNNRFGHGIAPDHRELYKETIEYLPILEESLYILIGFFEDKVIVSELPDQARKEWRWRSFQADAGKINYPFHFHGAKQAQELWPVYVEIGRKNLGMVCNGLRLPLSPILSVQQCEECNEFFSAFFLHGYEKKKAVFLEFIAKGSQTKKNEARLQKLSETAPKSIKQAQENSSPTTSPIEDDKYIPMEYFLEQLQTFISSHSQGIISLDGPGGVGKSWFCKNIQREFYRKKRKIEVIYLSLQYYQNADLLTLQDEIEHICKQKKWKLPGDSISMDEQHFFPELLKKLKENCPQRPLILVLDGLDELPGDSRLFNYLGYSPQDLPPGCFMLVSHRPNLRKKAKDIIQEMLEDKRYSITLEMNPQEQSMKQTVQDYLTLECSEQLEKAQYPQQLITDILEKSQGIFLYVYHYCYLLNLQDFDKGNLPTIGDMYTVFFRNLQERVGLKFFSDNYIPLLCTLAVAKEPVSLDQLIDWGISESFGEMAIGEIFHLLQKDTSEYRKRYSIRHQDILQFCQQNWREECIKQEASILTWAKRKLQEVTARQENELDEQENYALYNVLQHWRSLYYLKKSHCTDQEFTILKELQEIILKCIGTLNRKYFDIVAVYLNLAQLYNSIMWNKDAITYYQQALSATDSQGQKAWICQKLAVLYNTQAQYSQAIKYYEQARLATDSQEYKAYMCYKIADMYQSQKQYEHAIKYYQEALSTTSTQENKIALCRKIELCHKIVGLYTIHKQYDQAIEFCQQSLEILEQAGKTAIYRKLAALYEIQKKYNQAITYYLQALENTLSQEGKSDLYHRLAELYKSNEEYENAIKYYQKTLSTVIESSKQAWIKPLAAILREAIQLCDQRQYSQVMECYERIKLEVLKHRFSYREAIEHAIEVCQKLSL